MSDEFEVEVLNNGPYIVTGLKKMVNSKSEQLDVKEKVALCRCGASQNKPYCDGSHREINFTDENN
ncbi:MAG: CDGSH iron-sulfur domain-containing protein [Thermodesulfobacteriota bacterium]